MYHTLVGYVKCITEDEGFFIVPLNSNLSSENEEGLIQIIRYDLSLRYAIVSGTRIEAAFITIYNGKKLVYRFLTFYY